MGFSYLTLRRLNTDMEEAGFCGRGMMGVEASLGRGGGGGGGGGWYHEGWEDKSKEETMDDRANPIIMMYLIYSRKQV